MVAQINITLNDNGHFQLNYGSNVIICRSIPELLLNVKNECQYLACFPNGNMNCMIANPLPYESFKVKKEIKENAQQTLF